MCMCCFVRLFAVIFFNKYTFQWYYRCISDGTPYIKIIFGWKVSPAAYRISNSSKLNICESELTVVIAYFRGAGQVFQLGPSLIK